MKKIREGSEEMDKTFLYDVVGFLVTSAVVLTFVFLVN